MNIKNILQIKYTKLDTSKRIIRKIPLIAWGLFTSFGMFIFGLYIGYLFTFNKQNVVVSQNTDRPKESIQIQSLHLENSPIKTDHLNKNEQKDIENFIYDFEHFRLIKDVSNIISSFTPPASEEEQNELDFMMGKDLAMGDNKPFPRLFITQLFNNSVGAAVIKEISRPENKIIVLVDELRITYSGLTVPPDTIGYTTTVETVVLELVKTNEGYKIDKYHRQNPQNPNKYTTLKYEGLYS